MSRSVRTPQPLATHPAMRAHAEAIVRPPARGPRPISGGAAAILAYNGVTPASAATLLAMTDGALAVQGWWQPEGGLVLATVRRVTVDLRRTDGRRHPAVPGGAAAGVAPVDASGDRWLRRLN